MNEHATHGDPELEEGHGGAHPPAEEDVVPSARIVWVGVIALIVFAIGSTAAGFGMLAMRRELNPAGPPPTPVAAGQAKIGMVEQRLFEYANQGPTWKEQADRYLQTAGWVDQDKGIGHIPISEAMDRVVKGERP